MKICVFLIIGFIQFVFSCDLNDTHDSLPVCPFKLFRRKRQIGEYTRWRANLETTPEFIVKVLDEDLNTLKPKKVIAVNIQPVTPRKEKIIIGGAMVTLPTTVTTTTEALKDYTRFIPPTTTIDPEGTILTPIKPSITDIQQFIAMLPRGKSPQRDESPPAGPQFVTRGTLTRQYAPITPVAFTRRSNINGPLIPSSTPTKEFYNLQTLVRTTPFEVITGPTKDKHLIEEYPHYPPTEHDSYHHFLSTASTEYVLPTTNDPFESSTSRHEADDYVQKPTEKSNDLEIKDDNKDSDIHYLSLYDDEDDEVGKKKDAIDLYLDKIKGQAGNVTQADMIDVPPTKTTQQDQEALDEEPSKNRVKIRPTQGYPDLRALNYQPVKKRKSCSVLKLRSLNFNSPRTLPEIVAQMKRWAEESPVAKWVDITDGNYTTMENPIYMMIVDDPSSGQIITAKQTVMIVAGIQGRDQHAVSSALYILYQLIEKTSSHTELLSKFRFWIIPVFNPDGYDYAMTFPHRRNWAKNLRQNWDYSCKDRQSCKHCEGYGLRCTIQPCYGVNLDRNFEYQWIPTEELRSEHPCGNLYAGERQLSETETRAFTKLLHDRLPTPYMFIAFKEGDVLGVMYPYSHTKKKRQIDEILRRRASMAARAAFGIAYREYISGQTSEFLPLYAGGIDDWVDSHLGIDNTYTIMMYRQADTYNTKLSHERVAHEAYAAMYTLVLQTVEGTPPRVGLMMITKSRRELNTAAVIPRCSLFLLALVIVCVCFI